MFKIKEKIGWRGINQDQILVVDCNLAQVFLLTGVSTLIWKSLEERSLEEIINIILDEYDIVYEVAKEDLLAFIKTLKTKGLIE